jgi:UPF0042 nucleotide-binding protein
MKPARLVILTGMSGGGKSVASKALEDLGYFCIDNLPVEIVDRLVQLGYLNPGEDVARLALVMDLRDASLPTRAADTFRHLRETAERLDVVFLDADDATLKRRFSETRRGHPLAAGGSLTDAIALERSALGDVRAHADWVVDTSNFTPHDLRRIVQARFAAAEDQTVLTIRLLSFGYKHGTPTDADIVLDVRFLPNPYFVADLRDLTGRDAAAADFVLEKEVTKEFLKKFTDLLFFLEPNYRREGKMFLTIAIGCTGGRHRSVAIAEEVAKILHARGLRAAVHHRDIKKT